MGCWRGEGVESVRYDVRVRDASGLGDERCEEGVLTGGIVQGICVNDVGCEGKEW